MNRTYLYIIGLDNGQHFTKDGPVKIGISMNPGARARELQIGNAERLVVRDCYPYRDSRSARFIEKQLHEAFGDNRLVGEWFDVPSIDPAVYIGQEAIDDEKWRFLGWYPGI